MKVGIILVFVLASIFTTSLSYAQLDSSEFGIRFLPTLLIEDKEGIIQVYAKQANFLIPKKIDGLTVTSLDSSIIRVLRIHDSDSSFVSDVSVKAVKTGSTKLFLAAPGFTPIELPVTVHGNKLNKEQLLVKATPDTFSPHGPYRGVISVELADMDGFPILATEDTAVSLTLSNNIMDIFQKNLVIKKGEYFTGTQFTIKDSGKTTIFASGQGLEGKSNEINVSEDTTELTLDLFTFPKRINISSEGTVGHIIAVLHDIDEDSDDINDSTCDWVPDSDGDTTSSSTSVDDEDKCRIVLAKKDIEVKYKVTNSIFDNTNISGDADIGESTGVFTIKKGSYWGHTTFKLLGGDENFNGTYDVTISSGDPISLVTESVEAVFDEDQRQEGDKFVLFDTIPIFASGNKELIGVVYLQDENNYPIVAEENLSVSIDSTDNELVSVDPVTIRTGSGSALVYGTVGLHAPDTEFEQVELNAAVEINAKNAQLVETLMFGPKESSLSLVAEPLISKVLTNTEFPIVLFMKDDSVASKFPQNSEVFVTPSNIVEVEQKQVTRGNDLVMLNSKTIGKGSENLKFTLDDFDTELTIDSLSIKPANIQIDHSETILSGINDIFSVQLLNSQGFPIFATDDTQITLIAKDESLIQVPKTVTIKKGDYFTLFDAAPKKSGFTEISALSEGIPLKTTSIEIKELTPKIEITIPTIVEKGQSFTAQIIVRQDNATLKDLDVNWKIDGGVIQIADVKTSSAGVASVSIISTGDQKVNIDASVSGAYYPTSKISKTVAINSTAEFLAFAEDGQGPQDFEKFEIAGIDPVIILVPIAIGIVGYMLKKQGMFNIRNKPAEVKLA